MKLQQLFLISLISLFLTLSNNNNVRGETNDSLNIETNPIPNSYLFNLTNMKPGDRATRKLTILNKGEQDFKYNTKVNFKGGSKKLYEEFLLKVSDSNGIIHEGKLKDFKGLDPRFLKSMNEEDLLFVAEFPYELGNEFQGLGFEVEFKFIVEGYEPAPPGDGGSDGDGPDNPGNSNNPDNPDNPTDSNQPVDPENPDDPFIPEDPGNPDEPSNTEPQDPDKINQQHPIDPETLKLPPVDGQILPSTATNIFNYVLGGFVLSSVGGILFFLQRRRTTDIKK